ncbi:MAG: PASTA domain-containing protein [Desulfobacterales bacterium]|uniref:PASTA domain-containing protein n=1 Tax=Candidatus Desulfatibia profunda TaxID=2841695 RepID=A0A8J6NKK6_9BACT|nr:PASTA domain-containing protein [Candidatus Desulfatibia profunda]MBL7178920.1 PASTA domain-containing protein [Desulfobacterales bacterium]MBU0698879.1 PASTA domain-containing protein [Pseudomonadota bacterium]
MITRIVKIAAVFIAFVLVAGLSAYVALTLIIKSEDTVIVPDLVGKNVVYVLEFLTDLGLNTKVKGSEYSTDVPKNHVIFQEPEPGTEIKKGRDVRIILSKGAKTILVPNLKGLSVQQSRIILEENGLCQGETSSTYNQSIEKDDIMAQVPSPGTLIARGGCVNLLVSMGIRPQAYMMPDLIGLSLDEAIPLIERSNLVLGDIKSIFHEDKPQNTVVRQEPLSGHRVFEGNVVNLVINRKSEQKDEPYISGTYGVSLFRHRLKNGFLKRHIRVRLNSFGVSNDIFDDVIKPGEEVWVLVPKNINASVLLYENDKLIKTEVFNAW